ncbi:MAG: GDP-L-fucose synthase [Candidatus Argoarchaeum ethanivorans]|uniref:GDP-L-fucose synthase n=1 Tax=Candidatus Argoarchaeum ethanivorans TaxID=2608793 RepID=A0A811TCV9_9EURY|nr:MAG: GDP-L-fucose synthase [Candidatus Argoarchaeum ethanivorans]
MRILVTGGSGFIGSNFVRYMLNEHPDDVIINLDKLTYAGNPDNLKDIENNPNYSFVRGDICDPDTVDTLMQEQQIDHIVHFAAETHVDRSITDGSAFVRTNLLGTYALLDSALRHGIDRFIHISTDEVYGSTNEGSFKETDVLNPSSPYSSSKAGSDLLARSYYVTYDLPVIITRCTNNFGSHQYPEKLIPLFITNLLEDEKVPVYGTGQNVRDWIYVLDHCRAIDFILQHGGVGEIYNIGGGDERTNLEITENILEILGKDDSMVEHVKDRPGHDFRYSLDCSRLKDLGWVPKYNFEDALEKTIGWYIENEWWWKKLKH